MSRSPAIVKAIPSHIDTGGGIRIRGLLKTYPQSRDLLQLLRHPFRRERVAALRGIDLDIPRGGIYSLLGPNGAGKTTLLKMLGGLLLPDAGTIEIDGTDLTGDPEGIRDRVGLIVCDERSFFWRLTARENLRFFASLHGIRGVARDAHVLQCLASTGLEDRANTQFMRLSTGMRQRLAVARGMLVSPSILLMDEATRSLDPESQTRIHALVKNLVAADPDRIIVYSTHDLAEAQAIADHVIVIRGGELVTDQRLPTGLDPRGENCDQTYRLVTDRAIDAEDVEPIDGAQLVGVNIEENSATIRLSTISVLDTLIGHLRDRGYRIVEAARHRSTMMDLYMGTSDPHQTTRELAEPAKQS